TGLYARDKEDWRTCDSRGLRPLMMDFKPSMELPLSISRSCLVCGAPTTSAHYGVDACRACTVFYRKARKKKPYACRTITRRCIPSKDGTFACKRCRFDRFERILRQSNGRDAEQPSSSSTPHLQIPDDPPSLAVPIDTPRPRQTPTIGRPLLEQCAICYKMLCVVRRNSELNARPNPPHPSKINAGEYEITPSTYTTMNNACRFFVTAILDTSQMLFPELATFTRDEQWTLAVGYYNRIFMLDAVYRAETVFPDDMNKCLGAYTSYMSVDMADQFFDDCPYENSNTAEAKEVLKKFMGTALPSTRKAIHRANLDETEFDAVLILSFWFADCLQMRDEIGQIAERYRQQVLRELQAHYKEDLKLEDYAARIGELFMLIFNFDRSTDVNEQFEIYRLLGVFTDDTFVYRMCSRPAS
ncbi:hypothetical protein PMAYCL1PPCAC_14033, partial [Pristionchus mayeri]